MHKLLHTLALSGVNGANGTFGQWLMRVHNYNGVCDLIAVPLTNEVCIRRDAHIRTSGSELWFSMGIKFKQCF